MPIRGVILVAFILGSLPVCFVRPVYGVLLWTAVAFVNPQWYTWSAARTLPWAEVVAVPTLLGWLVFCRGWTRRLATREVLLLVGLWLWFTLTSFVSSETAIFAHHADFTWLRWRIVSKELLMIVVTICILDSPRRLRLMALTIAGSFGFYILKAAPFIIRTGGAFRLYGPPKSMIADNNDFGLALNMTLPFFFFLAQTEENPWVKQLFAGLFLITIPAIFFTYSRGALVGLILVLGLMILQSKRRLISLAVLSFALMVGILFAPDSWKARMNPDNAMDASARDRIDSWTFAWRLALDYPIAGGGFDTFTPELFSRYDPAAHPLGPHSVYFQILAEHGFMGLFLYGGVLLSCFVSLRKVRKYAAASGHDWAAAYANIFRYSLLGFMASGTFLGRAYFDYIFTIIACVVVLKNVALGPSDYPNVEVGLEEGVTEFS